MDPRYCPPNVPIPAGYSSSVKYGDCCTKILFWSWISNTWCKLFSEPIPTSIIDFSESKLNLLSEITVVAAPALLAVKSDL